MGPYRDPDTLAAMRRSIVHIKSFPDELADSVNGFVRALTRNGSWIKDRHEIFIDGDKSPDIQYRTLLHELSHVKLNHFYCDRPASELDAEADTGADKLYKY